MFRTAQSSIRKRKFLVQGFVGNSRLTENELARK